MVRSVMFGWLGSFSWIGKSGNGAGMRWGRGAEIGARAALAEAVRGRRWEGLDTLEERMLLSVTPLSVVLISDAVVQAQQIRADAATGTIAIVYHADSMTSAGFVDLLASVSAAHDGARIGHLGIVTHGGPGELDLGRGDDLNLATLPSQAAELGQLRSVLTTNARLDLYSCSVAAGTAGKTFVDELAAVTGASVFASDDPVGTVTGADFVWEYHSGQAAARNELLSGQKMETIQDLSLATQPWGTALGQFNNVWSYSNASAGPNGENPNTGVKTYNYSAGVYTGLEWQCVEYVNRYYYSIYGMNFGAGRDAWMFYSNNTPTGLTRYANGGSTAPQVGDILCFNQTGAGLGHVAIIRSVDQANSVVHVIQQNVKNGASSPNGYGTDDDWKFAYSVSGGIYTIDVTLGNVGGSRLGADFYCQGWLRKGAATPLLAPTLSNPVPGATNVPTTTGFSWSQVSGNHGYRIVVSTNASDLTTTTTTDPGTGGSIVFNQVRTQDTVSYTPAAGILTAGTVYYWEVHALGSTLDEAGYWSQGSFTTAGTTVTDSQKQSAMLGMVNNHRSSLPAELVLAVIFQEGGQGAFHVNGSSYNSFYSASDGAWAQPTNGDGIMQNAVAYHQPPYTSDQAGYDHSIDNGTQYLKDNYSTYGTAWQAALHYNTGGASLYIYKNGMGDPQYLSHVAGNLQTLVPNMFGLSNATLVANLQTAQQIVNQYLNNSSILSNQSPSYYSSWQTQLDNDLHNIGVADTTAPTPNPSTWSTAPYATGTTSISMTATTASDASGVLYYFHCLTSGGHDSAWQASPSFTDTALTPNTPYTYQVRTRDQSAAQNTGSYSTALSATTQQLADTTAPTPNPSTWSTAPYATGTTSISMTATTASDASGVLYYFHCLTSGGHDSAWQASPSFTDTALTPNTPYTYQVRTRDQSAAQNTGSYSTALSATTQQLADTTAPTPNPSTWATAPYAIDSTSISMTATTASDPSGVWYQFHCLTAGGHDSGWRDLATWTDTGLVPGTTYTYQVRTADNSPALNIGAYSISASATTQAAADTTAPTPNPSTWAMAPYATGTTSITMTATTASDPAGVQYFFWNLTLGGHDSGWQDSASFTDTGLAPNTTYNYQVHTRDKSANWNVGYYSTTGSATTQQLADTTAPTPNPSTWATAPYATGTSSISMTATTASDPSGVLYYFHCLTSGGHDSAWQASPSFTDTALMPNTTYSYQVRTRDQSAAQNTGSYSTALSATTQQLADVTAPALTITYPANNATVSSASLTVTGTASDSGRGNNGIASVTVNGGSAVNPTASGANTANWSAPLTLSPGANTITVIAKDGLYNSVTQQITVTYTPPDATAPALTITYPANNATVSSASLTVTGTASDSARGNNGISSVTVNGITTSGGSASGTATANWSAGITLSVGANTITVVAKDTLNNSVTQQITVTYAPPDVTAPALAITYPLNNATVTSASLTVTGTASDSGRGNNGVSSVTVNGITASGGSVSGTTTANWSAPITLSVGTNTITVVAKDTLNNSVTQQITVTYAPPATTRVISLGGSLAFGSVTVGSTSQLGLTIYNTGNSALSVTGITYPTGFSGNWSGTVAAGGSQTVAVTFAPTSATDYSGTVTVNSNETGGTNTTTASGTGATTLADGAQLLSESLPAGTQETANTSFTEVVTMKNTGTTTWSGGAAGYTLNRSGAAQFGESSYYVTLDQSSVSPGSNGTFTLHFTAPATPSTYTETWQMSNAASTLFGPSVTVQFVVSAAATRVMALGGSLAFGNVTVGSSATSTMTIFNTGTSTLTVSGISYPTGFSGAWSGTIAAGSSHAVAVTFAPTSASSYNGTVTVNSDETSGLNTMAASGTGTAVARPSVTIVASDPNASEVGSDTGRFTVTRTGSTTTPLTVFYTIGGSATDGSDYTSLFGTVTFLTGQSSTTITVTPVTDAQTESSETVTINLDGSASYVIGSPNSATVTISDAGASPSNDSFANRTLITGAAATITATNANAAKEAGEPNHANISGGASIWWTWTAAQNGMVQIDTIGSNFDTVLAVYSGTSISGLTPVVSNDDGGGNLASKVTFNAAAGATYQIAVDGFGGGVGNITLNLRGGLDAIAVPDLMVFCATPVPTRITYVPGDTITVPLWIENLGDVSAVASSAAPITFMIRASTDNVYDDADTFVAQLSLSTSVGAGATLIRNVTFKLPAALPAGGLYFVAKADTGSVVDELVETNNTASTETPLNVVWQSGNVAGRAGSTPLTFNDIDGTQVTLRLTGPGTAILTQGVNGFDITTNGTTNASTLTISTTKSRTPGDDGRFTLHSLIVGDSGAHTDLRSISASTTDLTGDLTVTGGIASITLGNIADQHTISIGAPMLAPTTTPVVTLTLGQVSNATLTSAIGIASLRAINWLDTDASPDQITAPFLGTLNVTGRAARGVNPAIAGDFQASLLLAGPVGRTATSPTLQTATIAGSVPGTAWDITGKIGTVRINGTAGSVDMPFRITHATDIGSLTLGDAVNATVNATGNITTVSAKRWSDGSLSARTLRTLNITGRAASTLLPAIPGDVAADLTLTGPAVSVGGRVLGSVNVAHQILGGAWTIAGPVGSVIAKSVVTGWSANVTGAGGNIGSLTLSDPAATSDLEITANAIQTLAIRGNLSDSHIVLSQPVSLTRRALGSLSIGTLLNSQIRTAGNIGTINAKVLDHSLIFAGVLGTVAALPTSAGQFIDLVPSNLPTISSVTLTGLTGSTILPALINSSIAAGTIDTVRLPNRLTAVFDTTVAPEFGFVTRTGNVRTYVGPLSTGTFVSAKDSQIV